MYLDIKDRKEDQRAMLESEILLQNSGEKCVQFFLKTVQDTTATLKVNIKNKSNGETKTVLESKGYVADGWVLKEAQLDSYSYPYTFIFEGVAGPTNKGRRLESGFLL